MGQAGELQTTGKRSVERGGADSEVLKREPKVLILRDGERGVIHKIYRPPWWIRWRSLVVRSTAQREFLALKRLREAGIPALVPRSWGEERWLGMVVRSCITTDLEQGCRTLKSYLEDPATGRRQRREALVRLGAIVQRMHAGGVAHQRLSPKNILVRERAGTLELILLDVPHARIFSRGVPPLLRRVDQVHLLNRRLISRVERLVYLRACCERKAELRVTWRAVERAGALYHKVTARLILLYLTLRPPFWGLRSHGRSFCLAGWPARARAFREEIP